MSDISETVNNDELEYKPLNEYVQIGDTVKLDGQKGYVIGEFNGQIVVQIQGSTRMVDPSKVKENKKPDLTTMPNMKFDEKTQKLLFEQYVKCAIYLGNVPIKFNDCYVKYSSWNDAKDDQNVKVLMEGNKIFMPKNQIRILEDVNDFANEDNYIPGVIIDEETETVLDNILINAEDYTEAIGDADPVRVIRGQGETQEPQTLPKAILRTLAV